MKRGRGCRESVSMACRVIWTAGFWHRHTAVPRAARLHRRGLGFHVAGDARRKCNGASGRGLDRDGGHRVVGTGVPAV